MTSRRLTVSRALWIVCSMLTGSVLLLPSASLADGAESPEAVLAAGQAAAAAEDWKGLMELVAPSERAMMAFQVDMAVSMMVEFWEGDDAEAAKEQYQKARTDFSVPEDVEGEELAITSDTPQEVIDEHVEDRARSLFAGVDTVGYTSTLIGLMLDSPMMEGETLPFPQGSLEEVDIDGDRATGKIGEQTLSFMKEGGRWYLTADAVE